MTSTYVGAQLEVAGTPLNVLVVRVVEVTVHNLFGHREWPLQPGGRELRVQRE